jgi:hypothetical protein
MRGKLPEPARKWKRRFRSRTYLVVAGRSTSALPNTMPSARGSARDRVTHLAGAERGGDPPVVREERRGPTPLQLRGARPRTFAMVEVFWIVARRLSADRGGRPILKPCVYPDRSL